MKMYFFSNKKYGDCFTVMAESIKDAKQFVRDRMALIYANEKEHMPDSFAKRQLLKQFEIREYNVGEVLETEYS